MAVAESQSEPTDAQTDTESALTAAIFLDKGGTGKTTTTGHLGRALTELGLNGILLDLAGKQSDLAKQFGVYERQQERIENGNEPVNISTVLRDSIGQVMQMNDEEDVLEAMIYETGEGVDLIPGHPGLDTVEGELNQIEDRADRYGRLRSFVDDYLKPRYDFVLIDLPGMSSSIPYNGVWAAENLIAPVEDGSYEYQQAQQLVDDVKKYRDNWGEWDVDATISMVVRNKNERATNLSDEYEARFSDAFGETMSPVPVPKSQDIRNATDAGQTIFELESPSTTAQRAQENYLRIAAELVERLDGPADQIADPEEVRD